MSDNSRKILITYAYGSDVEESGVAGLIHNEIESRLPLRNIRWQNPLGTVKGGGSASRAIHILDVELKKFMPDMFPRVMPGTSYHTPFFLHLFFVNTDDSDYYKATIRKQIQEWLNVVANKKSQEWLIVYVSGAESRGKSARFLGVGSSIFDRIKSDFNFKKERYVFEKVAFRDYHDKIPLHPSRCVRVKLYNELPKDAESWSELIDQVKEGISSSLNQQILQYDEDSRRLDQQRLMPGWNYCQYFILKEGLAYTFELVNLLDEALLQYDELEASFFQTLAEQGAPWFSKFGGTSEGDDSGNLLDTSRKPYRSMIMQNTISIFDFRVYLFARQCQLLLRMRYPVDVCKRAKLFITQFARTIEENKVSLIPHFNQAWVYSACMSIVSHCEELVAVVSFPNEMLVMYEGAKVDLLLCARAEFDKLGKELGYLCDPMMRVSKNSLSSESESTPLPVDLITNLDLRLALSTEGTFDEHYMRLTAQIAKGCETSHRYRTLRKSKDDLAQLLFVRGRFKEAADTWEAILESGNGWTILDSAIMECLAICYEKNNEHSRFLEACLWFVLRHPQLSQERAEHWTSRLLEASTHLDAEITKNNLAILQVSVTAVTSNMEDDSHLRAIVCVKNTLSMNLATDDIVLSLTSMDNTTHECRSPSVNLRPGVNLLELIGKGVTQTGVYTSQTVRIQICKLRLLYGVKQTFRLAGSFMPIRITAGIPNESIYGQTPTQVQLRIFSGRDVLNNGCLGFPVSSSMILRPPKTVKVFSENMDERTVTVENESIPLPNCGEREVIELCLPFELPPEVETNEHRVKLSLTYRTNDTGERCYVDHLSLNLADPLNIRHQVVNTPKGLFVQVSIKATGAIPLRIQQLTLASPPNWICKDLTTVADWTLVDTQEIYALYLIVRRDEETDAEVEEIVLHSMSDLLREQSAERFTGLMQHFVRHFVLPNVDYSSYARDTSAPLPAYNPEMLRSLMDSAPSDVYDTAEALLATFFKVRHLFANLKEPIQTYSW
ncbi:hypothetical protein HDU85_004866 [Gaertneriomyces sp. JEL0708]|nr:hypothetical protein HDU85_004866 [Gaertneriomyces sp. JEL0708]